MRASMPRSVYRRRIGTKVAVVLTVLVNLLALPLSSSAFHVQRSSRIVPSFISVSEKLQTSTSLASQKRAAPKNNDKKRKGQRFSQTVHQPTGAKSGEKFDADRMWKNKKSIDQLEDRLTSRWGTELKSWTAQDGEYDDDDEHDPSAQISEESSVFRGRPVKDPWQPKEEKPEGPAFLGGGDNSGLSRRARKNQERLKAAKGEKVDDDQPEFYDFDDVGYEPKVKETKNGMQVDDLIAPKPAGGKGSFENDSGRSNPQESFFFSSPDEREAPPPQPDKTVEEKPKRKEERERSQSLPILDEDGNPLFLTVGQAERNFEESLVAAGSNPDEVFTSDGDDMPNRYRSENTRDWEDLGVTSPQLLANLATMGCDRPLAVQDNACPSVIEGKDVLVGTYTGSGKTLAFLVPLAQRLLTEGISDSNLQVLIIAPGRELASQIVSVARDLLQGTDISAMLAIGGTTFGRNLEQIRKRRPTILVGTPGRIAELVVGQPGERSGRLKINTIDSLVLDEFDALLEYKPHREPTNAIMKRLKQQRGDRLQSILCSATATDLMGSPKLNNYLREDFAVAMAEDDDLLVTSGDDAKEGKITRVSKTVIHGVIHVPHRRFALSTLRRILHTDPLPQQILIFAENSRKVKIVVEKLEGMGIIAAPLHGGMGSEKMDRAEVSKALREGYVGIVVATELAARGLDAPLLTHVINLDLPTDASHYAHRAGRCGRGGRPGVVINITTQPQERNVPQKFADKLGIEMQAVEPRNGKLNIVEPSSQDID